MIDVRVRVIVLLVLLACGLVACTRESVTPAARATVEARATSTVVAAGGAASVRAADAAVATGPPCAATRADVGRATLVVDLVACRVVSVPSVEAGGLRYAATVARDEASYWIPAGDGVDRRAADGRVVEHVARETSIAGTLALVEESPDGRIRLLRRISGESVLAIDGKVDRVLPPWTNVAFAPDNRRVALDLPEDPAPAPRRLVIRDTLTGAETMVPQNFPLCRCGPAPSPVTWSDSGRFLLYEDGAAGRSTAWVFDTATNVVRSVGSVLPDARPWGTHDLLVAIDRGVRLVDPYGGPPVVLAAGRGFARFASVGGARGSFVFASDGVVTRVLSAFDGHEVRRWDVPAGPDDALAFAGDQPVLALATPLATLRLPPRHGCDGMLVIHSALPSGGELCVPGGAAPAWSPDASRLAYVTYEGATATLRVLDPATARTTSIVTATTTCGAITLRWLADGAHVVVAQTACG